MKRQKFVLMIVLIAILMASVVSFSAAEEIPELLCWLKIWGMPFLKLVEMAV